MFTYFDFIWIDPIMSRKDSCARGMNESMADWLPMNKSRNEAQISTYIFRASIRMAYLKANKTVCNITWVRHINCLTHIFSSICLEKYHHRNNKMPSINWTYSCSFCTRVLLLSYLLCVHGLHSNAILGLLW